MTGEFDIIARYFAPLSGPGGLDLLDDAAVITPAKDTDLVVSKDMLVAGVHFFENDAPEKIAVKALGVNLSDIAAKGATPVGYFLGLALPENISDKWLQGFSCGLEKVQGQHDFSLLGGDTVKTPGPLTISITIFGEVKAGQMIKRSGAGAGDILYVTGTVGDGALGLLERGKNVGLKSGHVIDRYLEPQPRVALGRSLSAIASAAVDVSDGLLADAKHMMKASQCGITLKRDDIPLSHNARAMLDVDNNLWQIILAGGDDYELLIACKPENQKALHAAAERTSTTVTAIGHIVEGNSLSVIDKSGAQVLYDKTGFEHF